MIAFLRLNGINAKEHPVFRELTRVKLYFDKISNVDSGDSKRETTLDTPAAGRFIKHALVITWSSLLFMFASVSSTELHIGWQ